MGRWGLPAWVPYLPLALAVALRVAGESTADLSYVVLAGSTIFGPAYAIRALVGSWLLSMMSPGIAPEASAAGIGRYLVLVGAAASVFLHTRSVTRRHVHDRFVNWTLLLGLFIIIHSLLVSPLADVSVLKAVSWTVAAATSLAAWSCLNSWEREHLADQLFGALLVLLLISLPLAVMPLGYLRNSTGFQGILNHPQALGPTMALLCAWAVARLLGEVRPRWWLLAIATMAMVAVLMSEARTAGLATVLGVAVALVVGPWVSGRSTVDMAPGLRTPWVWAAIVAIVLVALIMAASFGDLLQNYITKSGRSSATGLFAVYEASRGRVMDAMIENIQLEPWTGIGFGIDSVPERMTVSRDPMFGLPIGAAVEKGVTPLMVVEELGVIGALLVGAWVLALTRGAARGGLAALAVVLVVLFLNLGEATLFSPGGFGLLPMVLLGWAYSSGQFRPRRRYG